MTRPVFRFAPSPNGALHLGHAYSACLNYTLALAAGGRFLLRMEDIDTVRCSPALEDAALADLAWLGLEWEEPVRRQSDHFDDYRSALETLIDGAMAYPAFLTRGEVRAFIADRETDGEPWPRDPDGTPLYPDVERNMEEAERRRRIADGDPFAWRLDMKAALDHVRGPISWIETGTGPSGETGVVASDPLAWGDVVIARKETPTSYHLAVTIDDAIEGITDVVRGRDLFHATSVHRLLQELLGLPVPAYHHHDLILGPDGRKLSKSLGDTGISQLRAAGAQPGDIWKMVGLQMP